MMRSSPSACFHRDAEPQAGKADHRPSRQDLATRYAGAVPRYTSFPTAPHFHAAIGPDQYRAWLSALPAEEPVSLYLHVPFCAHLCWYCGCQTAVVRKRAPVDAYLDALAREIASVASTIGRRQRVVAIHLGGGTPNMLAPADLGRVVGLLRDAFGIDRGCAFAAELDPRIVSDQWVAAAAGLGLNRASLGVQDLDPRVQQAINRVQPFERTRETVRALREHGCTSINFDLMYGLPFQTVDGARATAEAVLSLQPERIALFGYAHVPWMRPHQRLISETSLPDAAARLAQHDAAAAILVAAGYRRIGLDHFVVRHDEMARAADEGRLRRNFQGYTADRAETLIGLGPSSISQLPQGFTQNAASTRQWAETVMAGSFATVRGLSLTAADRMRAEVIERLMCDLEVDLVDVAGRHDARAGIFQEDLLGLIPLEKDGLVRRRGGIVQVTDEGRAFLRHVCAAFDPYLRTGEGRHATGL